MSLQTLGKSVADSAVRALGRKIKYYKTSSEFYFITGIFEQPQETAQFDGGEMIGAAYELRVRTSDIPGLTRANSSFVIDIDGTDTTFYVSSTFKTGYNLTRIILRSE